MHARNMTGEAIAPFLSISSHLLVTTAAAPGQAEMTADEGRTQHPLTVILCGTVTQL